MNYSIEIDHELKLIRYKHWGRIKKDEIGSAWDEFLKLKEFTEMRYNLLSDYSDGVFDMTIEMIETIVSQLEQLKTILQGKKQSLVLSDPYSTAGSMLFETEVNKRVGFHVKVFSTQKAALNWLRL